MCLTTDGILDLRKYGNKDGMLVNDKFYKQNRMQTGNLLTLDHFKLMRYLHEPNFRQTV